MFDEIFLFVKLAETGSIKEAAQAVGMSYSTFTRSIQKLEIELSTKLFKGHAHHFDLTPEGQELYERFVVHKRRFSNEVTEFMQSEGKVKGTLRLALPHSITESIFPQLISWFKEQFPDAQLIITYLASPVNLLKDGFDLAISSREPLSHDHTVTTLGRIYSKLYATPEYCRQFGVPQTLEELGQHNWVVQTRDNQLINNFEAQNLLNGDKTVINYKPQFLVNNGLQALTMALSHQVIVLALDYFAAREVARGSINEILPEWGFGERQLYLIRNPHLNSTLEQEVVSFISDLFFANSKAYIND